MLTAIGPPTEFFVDLQRRVVIPSSFFYWYPLFSIDLALVNDSNLHSSLVDFSQYLGFCLVFVVKVKQSGYTSGPLSSWHTVHGLRGGGLYCLPFNTNHRCYFSSNVFLSSSLMVSFQAQSLPFLRKNFISGVVIQLYNLSGPSFLLRKVVLGGKHFLQIFNLTSPTSLFPAYCIAFLVVDRISLIYSVGIL